MHFRMNFFLNDFREIEEKLNICHIALFIQQNLFRLIALQFFVQMSVKLFLIHFVILFLLVRPLVVYHTHLLVVMQVVTIFWICTFPRRNLYGRCEYGGWVIVRCISVFLFISLPDFFFSSLLIHESCLLKWSVDRYLLLEIQFEI